MDYRVTTFKNHPIYVRKNRNTPLLIMMCGLPGSGKSSYAESIYVATPFIKKPIIHSSDKLRKEMFGDESTQGDNQKLFSELHRRIKRDLSNGKDVIYDATNIKKKERIPFLDEIGKIRCYCICVVMATEYEACLRNNENRERSIPNHVIRRMWQQWTPPHYSEGFDYIHYQFSYLNDNKEIVKEPNNKYSISRFFEIADEFNQENSHHSLSLGKHSTEAALYIQEHFPDNLNLLFAALLHDNGKLHTKTTTNSRGVDDGNCHYYNHNNVGSYNSLFYLNNSTDFSIDDMVYISNLIYYHMHPYNQWRQSKRVLSKDKKLIGDELYKDIISLHEADIFAH